VILIDVRVDALALAVASCEVVLDYGALLLEMQGEVEAHMDALSAAMFAFTCSSHHRRLAHRLLPTARLVMLAATHGHAFLFHYLLSPWAFFCSDFPSESQLRDIWMPAFQGGHIDFITYARKKMLPLESSNKFFSFHNFTLEAAAGGHVELVAMLTPLLQVPADERSLIALCGYARGNHVDLYQALKGKMKLSKKFLALVAPFAAASGNVELLQSVVEAFGGLFDGERRDLDSTVIWCALSSNSIDMVDYIRRLGGGFSSSYLPFNRFTLGLEVLYINNMRPKYSVHTHNIGRSCIDMDFFRQLIDRIPMSSMRKFDLTRYAALSRTPEALSLLDDLGLLYLPYFFECSPLSDQPGKSKLTKDTFQWIYRHHRDSFPSNNIVADFAAALNELAIFDEVTDMGADYDRLQVLRLAIEHQRYRVLSAMLDRGTEYTSSEIGAVLSKFGKLSSVRWCLTHGLTPDSSIFKCSDFWRKHVFLNQFPQLGRGDVSVVMDILDDHELTEFAHLNLGTALASGFVAPRDGLERYMAIDDQPICMGTILGLLHNGARCENEATVSKILQVLVAQVAALKAKERADKVALAAKVCAAMAAQGARLPSHLDYLDANDNKILQRIVQTATTRDNQ